MVTKGWSILLWLFSLKIELCLEGRKERDKGDRPAPKAGITFLNFPHKVSNKYCSRARCSARSDINYRCFYIQSSVLSLSIFPRLSFSDNSSLESLQLPWNEPSPYCSRNPRGEKLRTMPDKLTNDIWSSGSTRLILWPIECTFPTLSHRGKIDKWWVVINNT